MPHAIEEMSLNSNGNSNDSNSNVSTSSSVTSSPSTSLNSNHVVEQVDNINPSTTSTFVCCTEHIQNIPDVLEHIDTHHPGFINDREYGMISINANTTYSQIHGIPISIPNNRNNGVYGNGYLTNGKKILMSDGNDMFDNNLFSQLSFSNYLNNNDFNNYIFALKDPSDTFAASVILGNHSGGLENDPFIIGSFPDNSNNNNNNNQYTMASSPSSSDHSSISGSLEDDSLFFNAFNSDDINNQHNISTASSSSSSPISNSSSISNNNITSLAYSSTSNNISSTSATYSPISNANYSPNAVSSSIATSLINQNNNNQSAAKYIPNMLITNPTYITGNSTTITSSSSSAASSLVNNSNGNANMINQTASYNNNNNNNTTPYSPNYALYYNVPSVCANNGGSIDYSSRYPRIQPKTTSISLADICVDPSKSKKRTSSPPFVEDDRYNNKRRLTRINEVPTPIVGNVLPSAPGIIVNKDFSSQSEDKYPYKCTIPGCQKAYKNANGLKYHNEHGHVEQNDNGRSKPFPCRVAGCNKSYGSKGGLVYHIHHSHPQDSWALP